MDFLDKKTTNSRLKYDAALTACNDRAAQGRGTYATYAGFGEHSFKARHQLGMVGGTDVSHIAGNLIELESDLRGITTPLGCTVPQTKSAILDRQDKTNGDRYKIDTRLLHLPATQFWTIPGMPKPEPLRADVCHSGWRP